MFTSMDVGTGKGGNFLTSMDAGQGGNSSGSQPEKGKSGSSSGNAFETGTGNFYERGRFRTQGRTTGR